MSPILVEVPQADRHVVTTGEHVRLGGVNCHAPDVVWMGLKCCDFIMCVVVEASQMEVVRSCHEPVVASDEADASHWYFCDLEGLDQGSRLIVPDVDSARVQSGKKPWLCRMEVDRLDSIGASEKLPVDVQQHRRISQCEEEYGVLVGMFEERLLVESKAQARQPANRAQTRGRSGPDATRTRSIRLSAKISRWNGRK